MEFIQEPGFDQEQYDSCIRRLHYDDRDAVMYDNMLRFLWSYIICPGSISDREGLLEEYTHWNMQMIDKCFYHTPRDLPYANIRRSYQTVIHLMDGDPEAGLEQFKKMGDHIFDHDGRASKIHMSQKGKVYPPVSRLFLIYNYDKVLGKTDPGLKAALREEYPFAFHVFSDETHDLHDRFLKDQLVTRSETVFYPEYERVYRLPGGRKEFYLYFDEDKGIPIREILSSG